MIQARYRAYAVVTGISTGTSVDYVQVGDAVKMTEGLKEISAKTMIEAMQDPVMVLDSRGPIVTQNAACRKLFGYALKDIAGKHLLDCGPAPTYSLKEMKRAKKSFSAAIKEDKSFVFEYEFVTKKGKSVHVLLSGSMLKDAKKRTTHVIALLRDITERKKAEEALKESENLFRNLTESISDWTWEVNSEGVYTSVSGKIKNILGYTEEEVLGRTPFDLMPSEESEKILPIFSEISIKKERIVDLENWNLHKDGHLVCLLTNGFPILDEEGNLLGYRGVDKDITERKNAEHEVKATRDELEQIFNTTAEGMRVVDKEFNVLRINETLARMTGVSVKKAIGMKCHELFRGSLCHSPECPLTRIVGGEEHIMGNIEKATSEGVKIPCIVRATPFRDGNGELIGIIEAFRDITERREAEEIRRLQQYNRGLIEASLDPLVMFDKEGVILDVNEATVQATGRTREELIGTEFADYFTDPERAKEGPLMVFETGEVRDYELVMKAKDGTKTDVVYNASTYKDQAGQVAGVFAAARDITERKKAEWQLKERMKEIACLLGVSELLHDPDKPLDEAFFEMTEVIRQGWRYPDETCVRISVGDEEYESDGCRVTEWKMSVDIGLDGTPMGVIDVFYTGEKPESDEGPFQKAERDLIKALGRQVGAALRRKRAEETVKEQHQWLEGTLSSIGDAVIATDTAARVTFMNPVAESLTGWTAQEAMGQDIHEVFHIINELTRKAARNPVDRVLKEGITVGLANHTALISRNGREIPLDDSGAPIWASDGTTLGVVLVFRDITERRKAEETLRESEERLGIFMDSATDAFFLWDSELNLLRVNPAGMRIISPEGKPEDIIGKNLSDITPDKSRLAIYEEVVKTGESYFTTDYVPHPKFGDIHLNLKAFKVGDGLGIITTDITESVQKERLAVLGQLGAGIGHELRNPLGAIKNAAYFLQMVFEDPAPDVKETIDIIEKEVATSERIISSLLSYARPKSATRRKVNINDVIVEVLSTLALPETVEVVSQLDEGIPTMLADPDQLRQVFVNLILNAFQAMPKGGRLIVKSWRPRPGSVDVSVADTGVGIPQADLPNLFKPLFTTKAKGIGLGLAIVKTLVDGHDGTIDVQSEPDKGTTITVRIPVVLKEAK